MLVVVALLVVGVTARAGFWQLSRAHEKEALQARHAARVATPPLDEAGLARATEAEDALYDRPVALRGRWLPDTLQLLDNRPMDGRAGFEVVMALRLAGSSQAVVVVRGWAPRDAVDPRRMPTLATSPDEVLVRGHLAPPPSHRLELGAEVSGRIRQNLDLAALQRAAGAPPRPLVVVQDDVGGDSPADGLVRHWPAPTVTVDRNYGYAVQWFAMCAVAAGLSLWLLIQRPRRGRDSA